MPPGKTRKTQLGSGVALSTGALVHSKLMPSIEEKEKIFPSSKKVASRIVMKTIHTVERALFLWVP
jgi:hypothetical protein